MLVRVIRAWKIVLRIIVLLWRTSIVVAVGKIAFIGRSLNSV